MKKPVVEESQGSWDCKGNKKLELFLQCGADEVFYGGAAGGGKSEGLLISACGDSEVNVFNNANWKALILRRTYPELEKTLILRSYGLFLDKGRYDGVKHRWTFPGGGLIQFGHIKNEEDVLRYQSAEYNFIGFDELTHFTEKMYLYLFSRLRTTDSKIKCIIRAASNPGGIGHGWVKNRFIENGGTKERYKPYKIYKTKMKLPDGREIEWGRCFIPATVFDNKLLIERDPGYVRRMMELPDIERRALLYGDWDIFSGQFFSEFCEEHICDDFKIPAGWPIRVAIDYGFENKCAVLFFADDLESGGTHIWDEIYTSKKNADEISFMIKSRLGDRFTSLVGLYGDRRLQIRDEQSVSTREKFAQNGLYFQLADDHRENGWHRVRELMARDSEGKIHLKIHRRCANLIRVLPEQIFDPGNPDDLKKGGEDHLPDCLRYYATMRKARIEGAGRDGQDIQFSPVTGYIGGDGGEPLLRNQISRLPGLVKGRNYFLS